MPGEDGYFEGFLTISQVFDDSELKYLFILHDTHCKIGYRIYDEELG